MHTIGVAILSGTNQCRVSVLRLFAMRCGRDRSVPENATRNVVSGDS